MKPNHYYVDKEANPLVNLWAESRPELLRANLTSQHFAFVASLTSLFDGLPPVGGKTVYVKPAIHNKHSIMHA